MEKKNGYEVGQYSLRVIADHMEYSISSEAHRLRSHDIVFRGILYEICKFYKDFNFILYDSEKKKIKIYEVVKQKTPLIFIRSKDPTHIKTKLTLETRTVQNELKISGNEIKYTQKGQGKSYSINTSVKDIEDNLKSKEGKALEHFLEKLYIPEKKLLPSLAIGPHILLCQNISLNDFEEGSFDDMIESERSIKAETLKDEEEEEKRQSTERMISPEELSRHSTRDDGWVAIKGNVYDITEYSKIHPGGVVIFKGLGIDATKLFEKYHAWISLNGFMKKKKVGRFGG